jgi:hypothetical protein
MIAIMQQVLVRGMAMMLLVHAVGLDELGEGFLRDMESTYGVLKGQHDGMARCSGVAEVQIFFPSVQESQAVTLGLISQVVCEAAEAVDGIHVTPLLFGEQQRTDCEVLVMGPRQVGTVPVCFLLAPRSLSYV